MRDPFSPKGSRRGYLYGHNGQEKDDDMYGVEGTSYTAEYWQYDSRLGRRWNRDPKSNPSISEYAAFANNPIFWSDLHGDTLTIDGQSLTKSDIKSIAQQYSHFVKIDDNTNQVSIDYEAGKSDSKYYNKKGVFNQKSWAKDVEKAERHIGVKLITDLSTDVKSYFYSTSNIVPIRDLSGNESTETLGGSGVSGTGVSIVNFFRTLSVTPYGTNDMGLVVEDAQPGGGRFQGTVNIIAGQPYNNVVISQPSGQKNPDGSPIMQDFVKPQAVKRASYVFHELQEVYLRTHGSGMPYRQAHDAAKAIEGNTFGNEYAPGEIVEFKP